MIGITSNSVVEMLYRIANVFEHFVFIFRVTIKLILCQNPCQLITFTSIRKCKKKKLKKTDKNIRPVEKDIEKIRNFSATTKHSSAAQQILNVRNITSIESLN